MILKDLHGKFGKKFYFKDDVAKLNRAVPYVLSSWTGYYMEIVCLESGSLTMYDKDADILNEEIVEVELALVQV